MAGILKREAKAKPEEKAPKAKRPRQQRTWIDWTVVLLIHAWLDERELLVDTGIKHAFEDKHPSGYDLTYHRYTDGWNDKKVAEAFMADKAEQGLTFKVTAANVASVREATFGKGVTGGGYAAAAELHRLGALGMNVAVAKPRTPVSQITDVDA